MDNLKELYQSIYNKHKTYGRGTSCPAVREFNSYRHYLTSPVCDLGSGSGETVELLQANGIGAVGFDYVKSGANIVCDITELLPLHGFSSGICFDVLEHIPKDKLPGIIQNFKQVPVWAICINNLSSVLDGVELHINRQSYIDWGEWLHSIFEDTIIIKPTDNGGMLWLCKSSH
jgi:hypothetical protein